MQPLKLHYFRFLFIATSSFLNATFFYLLANITNKLGLGWYCEAVQIVICILLYCYKRGNVITYLSICFVAVFLGFGIWGICEYCRLLYPLLEYVRNSMQ